MEKWVRAQYIEAFCDANGNIIATKINLDAFRDALKAQRPDSAKDITSVVKRYDYIFQLSKVLALTLRRLDRETCSVCTARDNTMVGLLTLRSEYAQTQPRTKLDAFGIRKLSAICCRKRGQISQTRTAER